MSRAQWGRLKVGRRIVRPKLATRPSQATIRRWGAAPGLMLPSLDPLSSEDDHPKDHAAGRPIEKPGEVDAGQCGKTGPAQSDEADHDVEAGLYDSLCVVQPNHLPQKPLHILDAAGGTGRTRPPELDSSPGRYSASRGVGRLIIKAPSPGSPWAITWRGSSSAADHGARFSRRDDVSDAVITESDRPRIWPCRIGTHWNRSSLRRIMPVGKR
jgi:hypothetical protein